MCSAETYLLHWELLNLLLVLASTQLYTPQCWARGGRAPLHRGAAGRRRPGTRAAPGSPLVMTLSLLYPD